MRANWPHYTSIAAALVASGVHAQPQTFELDPAHSFVHFEVLHFGVSTLRGRFGPVQGRVLLNRSANRGEVSVRIATASISSGMPMFDARVRRADLLDTAQHAEAFFVSRNFRFEGERLLELRGEFTLRGISQPLNLRALSFGCRLHEATRREWCGGDFEATLKRSDYGITFGLPFVAEQVRVVVQVLGQSQ